MKKLLIIGASILQIPAIRKAKELGYYVGVADYNPQAEGIKYADEYFNVSTIDIDGVVDVAKGFAPDGIMTIATDMPMRAVAKACEVCGLPGISFDTAIKATDKGKMIKAFEEYDVDHPWYYIVKSSSELEESINKILFPCIMKPTDNAGSRGVVLCHNTEELRNNYSYSKNEARHGEVIIEEYLQGPEVSVEVIVIHGVPYVLQITDKLTTGAPYFVEMGHSQPTKHPEFIQSQIRDLACRACKAVGIDFGPAHVEIIVTETGPKLVELGARMGGDNITTHLVPLSTGIDLVAATIRIACGEQADIETKHNKGAAIRYLDARGGTIKKISGVEEVKKIDGIQEISIVHDIGETIGEIRSSTDRVGFVIAQAESADKAVEICDRAISKIHVTMDTDSSLL